MNRINFIIVMLLTSATAWAESVKYLYYDTTDKAFKESTQSAEPLPTASGSSLIYLSGWYYVKGNASIDKRLNLKGDTHIILCDDANLIINGENSYVSGSLKNLFVYAQSNGGHAGAISVTCSTVNTIDVNDFTIHGGKVSATANSDKIAVRVSNDFTIYGGQLNATANWKSGDAINIKGNMTVNDGQVTATANGEKGDAIYSASNSATLTVNGGKLTATALGEGGRAVDFENVVINGGQVTTGVDNYGIGGGFRVNTLTLGWTNASDYFKVSVGSWSVYDKWTAAKSFWIDGSGTLEAGTELSPSEATPSIILNTFDGKKFTPKTDAAVYKISVSSAITGGTVVADKEIAFEGEKVTLSVTPDEGVILNSISCSDGTNDIPVTNEYGNYTFVMPAADVTVTGTPQFYTTGVKYLDWDDNEKKLVEKNTATDDNDANDKVYILDGTETTLGTAGTSSALTEAWYIAKGNLSYNHYLKNANCCNIHLILEDGCDMSVDTEESPIAGDKAINVYQAALTIYGQSTGDNMGKLTAVSNGSSGILVIRTFGNTPNLTINGGQITAKGRSAINTYIEHEGSIGGITINGGKVIATGTIGGIYASNNAGSGYKAILTINGGEVYGTNSDSDKASITSDNDIIITGGHVEAKNNVKNGNAISGKKVTITGGQVEAIGGSNGCGIHTWNDDITLGWTDYSDYIKASSYCTLSYNTNKVQTAAGKRFVIEGTETVLGSADADYVLSYDELAAVKGKKLVPIVGIATGGVKYLAFTDNDGNRKLAGDDVQVYVVTGYDLAKGKAYLKAVEGNEIPKGMPVVIGNKTEGAALSTDFFLVSSDTQTTIEGELKNFVSCDGTLTVQDYLNALFGEGASEYIAYVVSSGSFTSVEVKASDVIKKGVCLLFISKWDVLKRKSAGTSNATTRTIGIGDGEATGIREVTLRQAQGPSDDAWYLLDGRKLSGQPTKKGIYIYKGQKVKVAIK